MLMSCLLIYHYTIRTKKSESQTCHLKNIFIELIVSIVLYINCYCFITYGNHIVVYFIAIIQIAYENQTTIFVPDTLPTSRVIYLINLFLNMIYISTILFIKWIGPSTKQYSSNTRNESQRGTLIMVGFWPPHDPTFL